MMPFSFAGYEKLLQSLVAQGYAFSGYGDWRGEEKVCILRHDVDLDMDCALNFARLERRFGNQAARPLKSTYFVLLSTEFYNPHALSVRQKLWEIADLGHDIGLHFDETQYEGMDDPKAMALRIKEEAEVLSRLLKKPVKSVSMHRPSAHTLKTPLELGDLVNSYDEVYFKRFKYLSDSRMNWREDVMALVNSGQHDKMHILTHPIWYREEESDLKGILGQMMDGATAQTRHRLSQNIRDFDSLFPA